MSQNTPVHEVARKAVVYKVPGMEAVTVRKDVPYQRSEGGALMMDLYDPPDSVGGARRPAVVIVAGYPDGGVQKVLGCRFKEMESSISWARLAAASGMVAITYTNREPEADLHALLQCVRQDSAMLGIDENRIGLWASSGNAPLALSALMEKDRRISSCAALFYPLVLDLDGFTGVAEAAAMFKFVNPCAGKSMDDLPRDVPLFIARAGRDQTHRLNEALDRFLARALTCNLPVTFVNHPDGPHSFDLFHDSETSREIVRQGLAFLQSHLVFK